MDQSAREDIPVIPSSILLQRIYLQRGLIKKEYGKYMQAWYIFTSMLKIGKIFDPVWRMEALIQLDSIFSDGKYQAARARPEIRNIKMMLDLYKKT